MELINHIEDHLGPVTESWKLPGRRFYVLKFNNCPYKGVKTFCTLGLSSTELRLNRKGKNVRQELLFAVSDAVLHEDEIASFMLTFAENILDSGRGLLRGELVGPGTELFSGAESNSIYCSVPVFWDERLLDFDSTPPTVFVWLIPILERDSVWIRQHGWGEFENLLETLNSTDAFWDPKRSFIF